MVNYQQSMIYKLVCKDPNITDFYVGSTTNIYRRKTHHKNQCYNKNCRNYNNWKYEFIRNNGGIKNWCMILIENVSCNNKMELLKIERDYIDKLKPSLNMIKSYITIEEKKEYNKKVKCNICNSEVFKSSLAKHQETMKCFFMFLDKC